MIPKKIHFCWLSGEDFPESILNCMASWKNKLPDYEIICWDQSKFDIHSNVFVEEACSIKKWAFASDFIRVYALYTEGGIYLDSDVIVTKDFKDFLSYDFFTSLEYHQHLIKEHSTFALLNPEGSSKTVMTVKPGIGLQAAIMGSIKGHPFLKECLDFYANQHFILPDGSYFNKLISPDIFAMIAEKFGFKYKDIKQELTHNMLILPSEIFASSTSNVSKNAYAIHCCSGSWRDHSNDSFFKKFMDKLKSYKFQKEEHNKRRNTGNI